MKSTEMREMTTQEWNFKPFKAYVTDFDCCENDLIIQEIIGWANGLWLGHGVLAWKHAFPLDWNKPTPTRMTCRQLSLWLLKGNGEWKFEYGNVVSTHFEYLDSSRNEQVNPLIMVRLVNSEEWVVPTVDLLNDAT